MVQFEIFEDPVETTGSPVPSEFPQCSLTSGFLSPGMSPPLQSTKKPQHFCRGFGSVCLMLVSQDILVMIHSDCKNVL